MSSFPETYNIANKASIYGMTLPRGRGDKCHTYTLTSNFNDKMNVD